MDDGSGRFTRLGVPTNWHHAEVIVSRGNRTYRFTVQANNLAGDSGFSNVVTATPWEPTFSWAPYSPRRTFRWSRTTDWSYEGSTISSACDPVPGNPLDPVCHRWIQFRSDGGEYYWYVDHHGVRYQTYVASAFYYREKYCKAVCVGPTAWTWNDFPPCHTGGPFYGAVYACSPYFGWKYLYSTPIGPSLPI
jgi:titin